MSPRRAQLIIASAPTVGGPLKVTSWHIDTDVAPSSAGLTARVMIGKHFQLIGGDVRPSELAVVVYVNTQHASALELARRLRSAADELDRTGYPGDITLH